MRFRQMDGLRAAAALAVVMIHASAGQTSDAALVWNQLSRFAVPLFLVLTGFGHAGATRRRENSNGRASKRYAAGFRAY